MGQAEGRLPRLHGILAAGDRRLKGCKAAHAVCVTQRPVGQCPGLGIIHAASGVALDVERALRPQQLVHRQPAVLLQGVLAARIRQAERRLATFGYRRRGKIFCKPFAQPTRVPGASVPGHEVVSVFVQQNVVAPAAHQNGEDVAITVRIVAIDTVRKVRQRDPQRPTVADQIDRQLANFGLRSAAKGAPHQSVKTLQLGRIFTQRPFRPVAVDDEIRTLGAPPFGQGGGRRQREQRQGEKHGADD